MKLLRCTAKGFTLIELVVVIMIASILAAFAAAQINTKTFDAVGFADQTAAMVRYAQKIAISQRRTVYVVFCANGILLRYTDATCGAGEVLQPPGTNVFQKTAPSGATLTGTTFSYNALGQPSLGPVTISVTNVSAGFARSITVEAATGYVH